MPALRATVLWVLLATVIGDAVNIDGSGGTTSAAGVQVCSAAPSVLSVVSLPARCARRPRGVGSFVLSDTSLTL
jgi:hypothetical protein